MKIELYLAIVGHHTFYWELLITENISGKNIFYALPQKVAGYYVIPSDLLSVCLPVCPSVRG